MTADRIVPAPAGAKCPLPPTHPLIWFAHDPVQVVHEGMTQIQFGFDHNEMGVRVVISTDTLDPGTFGESGGPYHHLSISAGYDKDGVFYPVVRPEASLVSWVLDDFMPVNTQKVYEAPSPSDPNVRHFFRRLV